MSEGIYENEDNTATRTAEHICGMTEVPKGSQQQTENGKIQDNAGGHYRRYKLVVVLVCVLFLVVTIALCITIRIITEEKVQLEAKFIALRDELQRHLCERESHDMKNVKQHAVNVILDADTANPYLILSADGKQVKDGDTWQDLPDTPKRFTEDPDVLGREGFSSGKFYYEVQVKGKTEWYIGVAKESINRTALTLADLEYGLWMIWLDNGTYEVNAVPLVSLSLKGKLQKVGVFVDYDAGLVSFYDAGCWDHIYSFTNISFTEKIYPYFSPGFDLEDDNSAPLIISPTCSVWI